jgi:hypothetical protein
MQWVSQAQVRFSMEFKKVVSEIKPPVKRKRQLKKSSHGVFVVNYDAIRILLKFKASALEICAFLILACFTKPDSFYTSTASSNALAKRLGLGRNKASELLNALGRYEFNGTKLIDQPECAYSRYEDTFDTDGNWLSCTRVIDKTLGVSEYFINSKSRHGLIRWEMPSKHAHDIWLNKNLVENDWCKDSPLKVMSRLCGDIACRLYLCMCVHSFFEPDIVHPGIISYDMDLFEVESRNGVNLYKASIRYNSLYVCDFIINNVTSTGVDTAGGANKKAAIEIESALSSLEKHNLIYRDIIVYMTAVGDSAVSNYYELDCKTVNKNTCKRKLWCRTIRDHAYNLGLVALRKDARFYDEYYAVAPTNMQVNVCIAYRLNYGITNPNTPRARSAVSRRSSYDTEVRGWLEQLGAPARDGAVV